MDPTYTSFIVFLIITMFYFSVKPTQTNDNAPVSHTNTAIYFVIVLISQFIINSYAVTSRCGGSASDNMSSIILSTGAPWTFIFGLLIVCLIMFPGFKSAFSNVVGYYMVSKSAEEELMKLLPEEMAGDKNNIISKIYGNKSILINKMVPSNFNDFAKLLKFKAGVDTKPLQNLVAYRDNVGEFCWYMYAAVFVNSVVQYNIVNISCNKSADTLEADLAKYKQSSNAPTTSIVV